MFVRKLLTLSKSSFIPAILIATMINGIHVKEAAALTANDVLNNMSSKEQTSYVAGVVGGLAQARWVKDKPDQTGMNCINNWFYNSQEKKWNQIDTWFKKHLEKPANALLYVLIKKECGA